MSRIKLTVEIPSVPNFIRVGKEMLSISDIPDDKLREIGEEWTDRLIKKANRRKV